MVSVYRLYTLDGDKRWVRCTIFYSGAHWLTDKQDLLLYSMYCVLGLHEKAELSAGQRIGGPLPLLFILVLRY